jgi:hypothetical protein
MMSIDRSIRYTKYAIYPLTQDSVNWKDYHMPFIFYCNQCGSELYKDSKPVLHDGTYRRETYLQIVITKIGGKCPNCGHKLRVPPLKIEVLASEVSPVYKRKREASLSV